MQIKNCLHWNFMNSRWANLRFLSEKYIKCRHNETWCFLLILKYMYYCIFLLLKLEVLKVLLLFLKISVPLVLWNHLWDTCRFILVLRYSLYPEVRFGMNITKIINFSCYSEGVWKFIHFIFIYFRYMYLSYMTLWCYSFSTNFIFECSMFEFLIVIYFVCVNSRLRILWNVILICKQYLEIQTTQLYINEYQGTTFMYFW